METAAVTVCSLPSWYASFKKVTIKTNLIHLSDEFIQYLLSDGIVLPQGCELPTHATPKRDNDDEGDSDWNDSDDVNVQDSKRPSFPDLVKAISDGINELGGEIFPKINQSSPKDALWISCDNTLKCTVPAEVILLMKSSDVISDTLTSLIERSRDSPSCILCLRQWIDIHPSGEFRCFVKDKRLIGVSQRQISNCYKHLLDNVEAIVTDISCFFEENHITNKFSLQDFVVDVYRPKKGTVLLIDFNPFHKLTTDPLLFSWEDLNTTTRGPAATATLPELRLVDPTSGILPSQTATSRLPKDAVDLVVGEDIHKLVDLLNIQRKAEEEKEEKENL